jgi:hypothetical protein
MRWQRFASTLQTNPEHAANIGAEQNQADNRVKKRKGAALPDGWEISRSATPGAVTAQQALVRPALEYPNRRETKSSLQRHIKDISRQLRLKETSGEGANNLSDWRDILRRLRELTRAHSGTWRRHISKVIVSDAGLKGLLSNLDYTLMDLCNDAGCALEVSEEAEPDGSWAILISGDETAAAIASMNISQRAEGPVHAGNTGDKIIPSLDTNLRKVVVPEKLKSSTFRLAMSAYLKRPPLKIDARIQRFEDIPRPAKWTKDGFLEYVIALTRMQVPPHLVSKIYGSGIKKNLAVISLLNEIFDDESARTSISTLAFKKALQFMAKGGYSFRTHARKLFVRMEELKLPMDTQVYNILLETTVKVKHLRNFEYMLGTMARQNKTPNLDTWILFMRIVESEEIRLQIAKELRSCGLLNHSAALVNVSNHLVPYDAQRAALAQKSAKAFLAEQDQKYGIGWRRTNSMIKVVDAFSQFGQFDTSLEILQAMRKTKTAPPNIDAINHILGHCRVQGRLTPAIAALRIMEQARIPANEETYRLLYELFRARRCPNATSLVWKYACLTRNTSHIMRKHVSSVFSLYPGSLWKNEKHLQDYAELSMAEKLEISSHEKPRHFWDMGNAIASIYLKAYHSWRPLTHLSQLLVQALSWDRQLHLLKHQPSRIEDGGTVAEADQSIEQPKQAIAAPPSEKLTLELQLRPTSPKRLRLHLQAINRLPTATLLDTELSPQVTAT